MLHPGIEQIMQNGIEWVSVETIGLMYRPTVRSSLSSTRAMLITGTELQYAAENTNMNKYVSHKKAIKTNLILKNQVFEFFSVNDSET